MYNRIACAQGFLKIHSATELNSIDWDYFGQAVGD